MILTSKAICRNTLNTDQSVCLLTTWASHGIHLIPSLVNVHGKSGVKAAATVRHMKMKTRPYSSHSEERQPGEVRK